jgi:hypothetical protein
VEAQQCVELTNTNRSRAYPNRLLGHTTGKQAKDSAHFRIQFSMCKH